MNNMRSFRLQFYAVRRITFFGLLSPEPSDVRKLFVSWNDHLFIRFQIHIMFLNVKCMDFNVSMYHVFECQMSKCIASFFRVHFSAMWCQNALWQQIPKFVFGQNFWQPDKIWVLNRKRFLKNIKKEILNLNRGVKDSWTEKSKTVVCFRMLGACR